MSTSKIIEELVALNFGASDAKSQNLYRTHLEILVECAKSEAAEKILNNVNPDYRMHLH